MVQWWLYRDGAIVGPVTTELVVRGLIAAKIPHDARVRSDQVSEWVPILSIDDFAEATQKTTLIERAPSMSKLEVAAPASDDGSERGRFWHAPEWMLLEGEHMSGPFTLVEIQRTMRANPVEGAQVCRLRTFEWLTLEEAFARGGLVAPPPQPESVTDPMWIVRHEDEDQGPTSLEQLAKAHAAGRLHDHDVVIRFGTHERFTLIGLLNEHGLARPKVLDRTVVVARKLGTDPNEKKSQALAIAVIVLVAALGVAALVIPR